MRWLLLVVRYILLVGDLLGRDLLLLGYYLLLEEIGVGLYSSTGIVPRALCGFGLGLHCYVVIVGVLDLVSGVGTGFFFQLFVHLDLGLVHDAAIACFMAMNVLREKVQMLALGHYRPHQVSLPEGRTEGSKGLVSILGGLSTAVVPAGGTVLHHQPST